MHISLVHRAEQFKYSVQIQQRFILHRLIKMSHVLCHMFYKITIADETKSTTIDAINCL